MNLSVILPCFNERANIALSVADVNAWMNAHDIEGEIIVVDDGSLDGSWDVLQQLGERIPRLMPVRHERNRGYGTAIRTGCDAAKSAITAFMDSDRQFHANDLSRILACLPVVPFVSGIRTRRADPLNRRLNAWLYGRLARIALGVKARDLNCGMKAFRADVWRLVRPQFATGALFNAEMYCRLRTAGLPLKEVTVHHYPRPAGKQTGARLSVILKMFRELFALRRAMRKGR